MTAIPDEMLEWIGSMWDKQGFGPVLVFRLLERELTVEQIVDGMTKLVGPDWADVKAGVWIDRIAASGNEDMIRSLETDEPPVVDILEKELRRLI